MIYETKLEVHPSAKVPDVEEVVEETIDEIVDIVEKVVEESNGTATVEVEDEEVPDEPVISFTEEAGNVAKAFEAISKETDIDNLKFALKKDERITVKKAIVKRILI